MIRTFIDGNSVGYSAHTAKSKLSDGERDTTAIFHALGSMRKIIDRRSGSKPIVLWDGRSWRVDTYKEYKGTRDNNAEVAAMRQAYKEARPHIARSFKFLGITQMVAANYEADDLAAYLTAKSVAVGDKVMLITGDKDWLQLIQHGVTWHDQVRRRDCSSATFEQFTGCKDRRQFVEMKAVEGDVGDNIKGVKGVGPAAIKDIFDQFQYVDSFLDTDLSLVEDDYFLRTGKKLPKKLRDFHTSEELRDQFAHDLALVDLYADAVPKPERIVVHRGEVDKEGFYKFCSEFGFASIMRTMDDWIKPFEIATAN